MHKIIKDFTHCQAIIRGLVWMGRTSWRCIDFNLLFFTRNFTFTSSWSSSSKLVLFMTSPGLDSFRLVIRNSCRCSSCRYYVRQWLMLCLLTFFSNNLFFYLLGLSPLSPLPWCRGSLCISSSSSLGGGSLGAIGASVLAGWPISILEVFCDYIK